MTFLCEHPYSPVRKIARELEFPEDYKEPDAQTVNSFDKERQSTYRLFPCGQCLLCRIQKRQQLSSRITMEASVHKTSYFVTLTYADEFITLNKDKKAIFPKSEKLQAAYKRAGNPFNGELQTLVRKDYVNYLKRLRQILYREFDGKKLRYFGVGEYGGQRARPHYHLMLFDLGPEHQQAIKRAWTINKKEIGIVHIGDVNEKTAKYIAGYTCKKLTKTEEIKSIIKLQGRQPEFKTSSTKPPIGLKYVEEAAKAAKKALPYFKFKAHTKLQSGKKFVPFDNYIRKKYLSILGVTESEMEDYSLDLNSEKITEAAKGPPGNIVKDSIVKQNESARNSAKKKFEIYKKRDSN